MMLRQPEIAADGYSISLGLPWRRRDPDCTALIVGGEAYSVGDILALAHQAAAVIADRTATSPKQPSNLLLPSRDPLAFMVGMIGAAMAGVVCAPFREDTIDVNSLLGPVAPDAILRYIDRTWHLEPLSRPEGDARRIGQVLMLTSGSTGAPKAVALDHRHIVMNAALAGVVCEIWRCEAWAIEIDMAFMSAVSHMAMAWQFDLPLVHLGGVDGAGVRETFANGRTGYGGSPIGLIRLADRLDGAQGPSVAISSGDFLTPPMIERLRKDMLGVRLNKIYGLTELGGRFCCLAHDRMTGREAAAGAPLPGFSLRVKKEQPEDEYGIIEAATPTLAHGYYHPDGSFQSFSDTWFPTGDVGALDAEGYVTIGGREDDVFKIGGEKVDRASIEEALSDLIGEVECCVLALKHPLVGQTPALFVDANAGSEITMNAVITHLRAKLPSRYLPTRIVYCEGGLPRLTNGKIDRACLRAMAADREPRIK